ncbi:MAG: polymerase sigma factor SigJ [Rhodospirillales bacterium]|jgi:RNA polymerase sigma-70 factor (ECF subfamily)|nr:polymerase sigma factor SigJ [Rhodospirillales bacterium]
MDKVDFDTARTFESHRRHLMGVAYRMLGSVSEAEDAVQEAYIRWHRTDRDTVQNAQAFLTRIVTRLCLDQLKSARRKRETYVGPWLPEPVLDSADYAAEAKNDYANDMSVALMLALERLSPLERAAFILHDVFEVGFDEVGAALGRSGAACRQLSSRAREHLRAERPRFKVTPEDGDRFANAFLKASQSGDTSDLRSLLAADAVMQSDGGGVKLAAVHAIEGADKIAHFLERVFRKYGEQRPVRIGQINGMPGVITTDSEGTLQTVALEIRDGLIAAIYIVRNPNKLAHIEAGGDPSCELE